MAQGKAALDLDQLIARAEKGSKVLHTVMEGQKAIQTDGAEGVLPAIVPELLEKLSENNGLRYTLEELQSVCTAGEASEQATGARDVLEAAINSVETFFHGRGNTTLAEISAWFLGLGQPDSDLAAPSLSDKIWQQLESSCPLPWVSGLAAA